MARRETRIMDDVNSRGRASKSLTSSNTLEFPAPQLDAFLEHAAATYRRGLPRYVERAFRAYLDCGIFAHGCTSPLCSRWFVPRWPREMWRA